jgi:hypothetical protein
VTYMVFVDDNFHFMNEDERYPAGAFETAEAAIAKCIVRASIESCRKRGMMPEEVFSNYCAFGEDPWVLPGDEFSAWTYAKQLTGG